MAKFRSGNLVLTSTQSIIMGANQIDSFSTDGTLTSNSDALLPTQKAVKTYVDTNAAAANKISQLDSKVEVTDSGSNGLIVFHTDGSERMRIMNDGKVGISNGAPVEKLDVLGTLLGGAVSATNGSLVLAGRYSGPNNYLLTVGNHYSSGGSVFGFGVKPRSGASGFVSSTNINVGRYAILMDTGSMTFLTAGVQTVSPDSVVTMTTTMTVGNGNVAINGITKADGCLYAGATDPTNATRLNYDGYFYATRVYNAVWNDIADFQDLADDFIPGKCYYDSFEGAKVCDIRCQQSVIGIASDTYGYGVGQNKDRKQVPIAVCGWVLAYVNGNCEMGDALTSDNNGNLIKMTEEEKRKYPERIVAIHKKREDRKYFGPENNRIEVRGRHWVKVK